jgi:transcriptional regulator with XRE-family HTH domain
MNRIKQLRIEFGFTQADLAKKLKISDRAIGYYENGEREPDNKTLLTLAELFKVSVDYLLGRTDIRSTNVDTSEDKEFMALYEGYKTLNDADKGILKATLDAIVNAKKEDK